MLVRDMLTGYLHEVPDAQLYGLSGIDGLDQVLYDGLGNPLGFFFLPKLISGAAKVIGGLIGGGRPTPIVAPPPLPPLPLPSYRACPPCPSAPMPVPGPYPMFPYPMPYGRRRRRRRDARS